MARVLVSAYACEPARGSEPGAGWSWVMALAGDHDVTVVTRANNRDAIESAIDPRLADRVRFAYVDLGRYWLWMKRHGLPSQAYYARWQWMVRSVARDLSRDAPFDVAHHVTFAVDWLPAGIFAAAADIRIWGPVGGSTGIPRGMWGWLPWQARGMEAAREILTRVARRLFGRATARRADLVLVQNPDGLDLPGRKVVVSPNIVVPDPAPPTRYCQALDSDRGPCAIVVGRLVPQKNVGMAIAALAQPAMQGWRVVVVGDGPDGKRLRRLAKSLGVGDRIDWVGWVPRTEALARMAGAQVMIMPSLHEAAGFVVGEAMSLGLPVVALRHGGAPVVLGSDYGELVEPGQGCEVRIAEAVGRAFLAGAVPDERWSEDGLPSRIREAFDLVGVDP